METAPPEVEVRRVRTPSTSLVGREAEVAAIVHLLGRCRLVTLLGPGGIGKTRLALAAASSIEGGSYPDGIYTVDLSALRDSTLLLPTIAEVVGLSGARDTLEALLTWLRDRVLLLVLDNFEQVVEAGTDVARLLDACADLSVLVTSRVPLRLSAEQRFPVPPLDLPATGGAPADLAAAPAVRLFLDRARAVLPGFDPDGSDFAAIADICRQLDGLPLAIELAASRVRLLPLAALSTRLQHRLQLLNAGPRDLPPRQQTLRAALDWSYDLLRDPERQLFAILGAFEGGASSRALLAVCADWDETRMAAAVEVLLDNSLVVQRHGGEEPRFDLLQTIREYALERLGMGDGERATRHRHALYFLALAEESESGLKGPDQQSWLWKIRLDLGNLRAALTWSIDAGEREVALRLGAALWRYWFMGGSLIEGRRWLDALLQRFPRADADPPAERARASVLHGAAALAYMQADYERGMSLGLDAVAAMRKLDDELGIADALGAVGNTARNRGDLETAGTCYEESLLLFRKLGDERGTAVVLNNMGSAAIQAGEYHRAAALQGESLAIRRRLGDTWGVANLLNNMAIVACELGELVRAEALSGESLTLRQELGDGHGTALTLNTLGNIARAQGDAPSAATRYTASLHGSLEQGDRGLVLSNLEGLAAAARIGGDSLRAARLLGATLALSHELRAEFSTSDRQRLDREIEEARALYLQQHGSPEHEFDSALAVGQVLTFERAVAEALQGMPGQRSLQPRREPAPQP